MFIPTTTADSGDNDNPTPGSLRDLMQQVGETSVTIGPDLSAFSLYRPQFPLMAAYHQAATQEHFSAMGRKISAAMRVMHAGMVERANAPERVAALEVRYHEHAAGRELDGRTWDEYPEEVR